METNILKKVGRNSLNYMKQFNKAIKDSLKALHERKEKDEDNIWGR